MNECLWFRHRLLDFEVRPAANTLVFDRRPPEMCLCKLLVVTCRTISALWWTDIFPALRERRFGRSIAVRSFTLPLAEFGA